MHPLLFHLGRFAVPSYGAFTALGLIAALAVLGWIARPLRLNPAKLWDFGVIGIVATLVAARLLMVVEMFGTFVHHPFWVLGVKFNRVTWVDPVALAIGFAAALLYALAEGLPLLRVLDGIAPAAALAVAFNRVGAFLGGLDYGLPATHDWSVTYASGYASNWYHTPLGVPLHPTQLYECIASLIIFALLLIRLKRGSQNHSQAHFQDGELWGAWLFLSGIAGFAISLLRASDQTLWTLREPTALVMVALSAAFLLRHKPLYTVRDDPHRI